MCTHLLEQVLEIEQHRLGLVAVDESGGDARLTAPTGTPDAMDIVLNLVRHVVVDHVLDVREVQTLQHAQRRLNMRIFGI